MKKGLEDKCKTLEAEHKEKSKKLYGTTLGVEVVLIYALNRKRRALRLHSQC